MDGVVLRASGGSPHRTRAIGLPAPVYHSSIASTNSLTLVPLMPLFGSALLDATLPPTATTSARQCEPSYHVRCGTIFTVPKDKCHGSGGPGGKVGTSSLSQWFGAFRHKDYGLTPRGKLPLWSQS